MCASRFLAKETHSVQPYGLFDEKTSRSCPVLCHKRDKCLSRLRPNGACFLQLPSIPFGHENNFEGHERDFFRTRLQGEEWDCRCWMTDSAPQTPDIRMPAGHDRRISQKLILSSAEVYSRR
jgi:hypothetical protein